MKRRNSIVVLALGILIIMGCMTGCSELGKMAEKSAEINQSVSLPEQYRIAYEVTGHDGKTVKIEKAKDESGNIYYRFGETEKLFIKTNDNQYSIYEKDSDGNFKLLSDWKGHTATYVQNETKDFLKYAEALLRINSPNNKSTGDCEVSKRVCAGYEYKIGAGKTAVTYTLQVDKETGICMSFERTFESKNNIGINDFETIKCIEFQTENITMPEYSN